MRALPDPLAVAYEAIRSTQRPIEEIAADLGITRKALDDRLRRRYQTTARAIRTGEAPTRGRPATDRDVYAVRLTEDEREIVMAAVYREREAGAETEGAALAAALQRAGRRSKKSEV